MNIFILDTDPNISASYHCDKHVLKMILESAQLLCTALHFYKVPSVPYRKTHISHPCSIWTRETRDNYMWVCSLGLALCSEYTDRYGKTHKTQEVLEWCAEMSDYIPKGNLTKHVQCLPEKYKGPSVVEAYREYYKEEKCSFARWKNGNIPYWW